MGQKHPISGGCDQSQVPLFGVYHRYMSHPSTPSSFHILGLEPAFNISKDAVERAYRRMLVGSHPDRGIDSSAGDSATLNRARAVLLNDERRANELLQVLGGPASTACKDLPDGFLMQMMMQREEIEEALGDGGAAERDEWEEWGVDQRRAYSNTVAQLFDGLGSDPTDESLHAIRVQLNAWRYIERLIEQLDPEYDPAKADF